MTLHPIAEFSKYPLIKTGVCMLTSTICKITDNSHWSYNSCLICPLVMLVWHHYLKQSMTNVCQLVTVMILWTIKRHLVSFNKCVLNNICFSYHICHIQIFNNINWIKVNQRVGQLINLWNFNSKYLKFNKNKLDQSY